jgi:hypothetical protein
VEASVDVPGDSTCRLIGGWHPNHNNKNNLMMCKGCCSPASEAISDQDLSSGSLGPRAAARVRTWPGVLEARSRRHLCLENCESADLMCSDDRVDKIRGIALWVGKTLVEAEQRRERGRRDRKHKTERDALNNVWLTQRFGFK